MSRIVIGTAGHIDHGKTALVKALTGIDTDRLKEEKARGITIELGFASLELPGGAQAAIIDVPGHERFIKNMLAGVAGIDLALLIVAANEGVMPQTREHLDILTLLEIRELIVVITKIDLVEPDFLDLIKEDLKKLLEKTPFQAAPMAEVSVYNGQGLTALVKLIEDTVVRLPGRIIRKGLSRLPVDRVFTVQGIGTVATGTLFDGVIRRGDFLEVPGKVPQVKVRSLQVHGNQVEEVMAGQRVALNLAGRDSENIQRGDTLLSPGWVLPSNRIDLSLKLLKDSPVDLVDMTRVRFHQGTKESLGRVFVLGKEKIQSGEEGFIQLVLEEPIVVLRGDNYILRSYSPLHTIGGGIVIEPQASKHKKGQHNLQEELAVKARGELSQLAALVLEQAKGVIGLDNLAKGLGLSPQDTAECLIPLLAQGVAIELKGSEGGSLFLCSAILQRWEHFIAQEINSHLRESPLSPGLSKELVRTQLGTNLTVRDYNILLQLLEERHVLRVKDNQFLQPYNFQQKIPIRIADGLEAVQAGYLEAAWQIPDWITVVDKTNLNQSEAKQLLNYMLREGMLIHLGEGLYLPAGMLTKATEAVKAWFSTHSSLTVAQFRDLLGTTRRVAIPLLEFLDGQRYTKRQGDQRVPGPALFDSMGAG